jgi:hypothetical protein
VGGAAFVGGQQIHQIDSQPAQNLVGHIRGEQPGPFQYVMDMRLRNSCKPGQAAFADFAVAHAGPDVGDQPHLEKPEVHPVKVLTLFLPEIDAKGKHNIP